MTILSANNDSGFILFGDDSDNAAGGIRYENATSAMSFRSIRVGTSCVSMRGRVTMPQQPSFLASQTTTLQNSATTVTYGQDFDIGNNYNPSNGRFTAPCSGVFFFVCSIQAHQTTHQTYSSIVFLKTVSSTAPASFKHLVRGADHTTTQGALAMQMSAETTPPFMPSAVIEASKARLQAFIG